MDMICDLVLKPRHAPGVEAVAVFPGMILTSHAGDGTATHLHTGRSGGTWRQIAGLGQSGGVPAGRA